VLGGFPGYLGGLENIVPESAFIAREIACDTVLMNLEARELKTPSYTQIKSRVYDGVLEHSIFTLGQN
jgi:hypothetical protein